MREILFRGKRKDTGEWVEGYLGVFKDTTQIFVPYTKDEEERYKGSRLLSAIGGLWYVVDPETVGQYTGLTDKNGTKIFEGDIVRHYNNSLENYDVGVIYWDFDFVGWRRTSTGGFHKIPNNTYKLSMSCDYEVIGNTHDNPKLLGGVDNGT